MSSESEISDYSQTSSEPKEEEMEEDSVQVIFSQIEAYQDEPLAEDGSTAEGNEVDKEADEDGYTPIVLEARYEREIPVNSWFV